MVTHKQEDRYRYRYRNIYTYKAQDKDRKWHSDDRGE